MLLPASLKLGIGTALGVVAGILFLSVVASMIRSRVVKGRPPGGPHG
jgi:hypothetical protein